MFAGYDLIVDGTDNFATRYLVNDAGVLARQALRLGFDLPVLRPGVGVLGGRPRRPGVNYRDLYPEPPPPGTVPSCAEGGVLGILCASVAAVMGTEAIKLITGIGETLLGRLMIYDALAMTYRTVAIRKDPGAPAITDRLVDYEAFCGTVSDEAAEAAKGSTITALELRELLEARDRGEDDFVLIDVREPNEHEIVAIPGSVLIPKGRFLEGSALGELPHERRVVLYCKVGARSAEALAVVKGAGFADAVHLGGGVLAWVRQVEPDKPSY